MNLALNDFSHQTEIQIRFSDVDIMGHVNNSYYLQYAETARMKYLHDVLPSDINWQKEGIIIAKVELNYLQPISLHTLLYLKTRCYNIGNKSFVLQHVYVSGEEQKQHSTVTTTIVCFSDSV